MKLLIGYLPEETDSIIALTFYVNVSEQEYHVCY